MNGEKRAAAGKLTPLITSQQRPVLEVAFQARASVCLSVCLSASKSSWSSSGGKDQQQGWREKRHGREEDAQECRKVEKWPKKEDEEKKWWKQRRKKHSVSNHQHLPPPHVLVCVALRHRNRQTRTFFLFLFSEIQHQNEREEKINEKWRGKNKLKWSCCYTI